ncbi:hypothetical protein TWF506_006805 [Arthrobotrys conoides]|uniref:Uncharacterized protein n=1 Tax=Arthrobotrys conoides TaxID=74498 RepID=A0AAN8P496_9PEZI
MVQANLTPLKYLLQNSTILHRLQDEYCQLGSADETPDPRTPTLTTLTSVIGEIVAKLDEMISLVQSALDDINHGQDSSDFGFTESAPQDLAIASDLRDQLKEYYALISGFQESITLLINSFNKLPTTDRPFLKSARNLSPFLCIVWMCVFYDTHGRPIPFPGTDPADIYAVGNAPAVTVNVDTDGRNFFKRPLEFLKELLVSQIANNQGILEWFATNIDNQKYNFQGLLPEWWIDNHGDTIESVISRIDNWVYCWKIWAPLDNLIRTADSLVPLNVFLPLREETILVAKPAGGWPWQE